MRHRISCRVFVMAVAAAFHGTVTAQSLNYSDVITVPQVDSKMPQICVPEVKQTASSFANHGQPSRISEDKSVKPLFSNAAKSKEVVYNNAWSGTRQELKTIVANAEKMYGFEDSKHLGRNATMLIPATRAGMELEIESGNLKGFKATKWDGAHAKNADSDDWDITWALKAFASGVVKYIDQKTGREAVYDSISGRCLTNTKLGTMNFNTDNSLWSATFGDHNKKDMAPNKSKADSATIIFDFFCSLSRALPFVSVVVRGKEDEG